MLDLRKRGWIINVRPLDFRPIEFLLAFERQVPTTRTGRRRCAENRLAAAENFESVQIANRKQRN